MRTIAVLSLLPIFAVLGAAGCSAEPSSDDVEPGSADETLGSTASALTDGPDLTVSALTAPPSLTGSDPFTASATICNVGNQPSAPTRAQLYLSTDSRITTTDFLEGAADVPPLAPGACAPLSIQATPPLSTGWMPTWPPPPAYLGAIVDPAGLVAETNEANNARGTGLVGIGFGPDLVVKSATAPAAVNGNFTATATVCNQGTAASPGAAIELHFSTDTAITTADPLGGAAQVPPLSAGACATVSVPGYPIPAPSGAYYLGAIVDPQNQVPELIETNDALAGKLTGVGYGADLYVKAISGPASAAPGATVTASATVCNQGTAWAGGAAVGLYFSTDATITTADLPGGSAFAPPLDPGACATVAIAGPAPAAGAYVLGAIVDPQNQVPELIETNGALAGKAIGVGFGPDLVVTGLTHPPTASGDFTSSVTVCNQGNQPASGAMLEIRLSGDTSITAADPLGGSAMVPYLGAGQCAPVSVPTSAWALPPSPPGAGSPWYVGALVDPAGQVPELLETNNAYAGPVIGLGYGPDLVVTALTGPASAAPGMPIAANATVCNQGFATSNPTALEVRLSTDTAITAADALVGTTFVDALAAGQCQAVSVSGQPWFDVPPMLPAAFYLGAVVDPQNQVAELLETNDTFTGKLLGFGMAPDFVITALSAPTDVEQGPFTAKATVCNQGTVPAPAGVDVTLVISSDATATLDDRLSGVGYTPALDPGQCATLTISGDAFAPPSGPSGFPPPSYLGAIVDSRNQVSELLETNGVATRLLGIGHGPDLVVSSFSAPTTVAGPAPLATTTKVCNVGTAASDPTPLAIVVSADSTLTLADDVYPSPGPGVDIPALAAAQCATVTRTITLFERPGSYAIGAIVDPFDAVHELVESNDVSGARALTITP